MHYSEAIYLDNQVQANNKMKLFSQLKTALVIQFTHLSLSVLWNITGIILLANGMPALGPTASLATIGILIALGIGLCLGAVKSHVLYLLVSAIIVYGAIAAITGAFSKPPSLWPSDAWRLGGAVLNSVAVVGAAWGVYSLIASRVNSNL